MQKQSTVFTKMCMIMLLLVLELFTGTAVVAEYWQQEVKYDIDAELNTNTHIIHGEQGLIYINNSPDTLHNVYFHLYQNAFKPGSYYDLANRKNHNTRIQNLSPSEEGGTDIRYFRDESGTQYEYSVDNTILRVDLKNRLEPGDSLTFAIGFDTKYGAVRRRMKREGNTYIGAHWYPRIAVYDSHRGWNIDQHLGQEFYGDFGTFSLSLTLPAHFIVGATGVLQNRDEVLPPALMQKIDIRNFADKPWGEPATIIIEPTSETKTWHYRAENVHDVAFVASPEFRIGQAEWEGVQVYSYAREQHASGWQDAASFTAKVIENYSKNWGRYPYPKIIVSDVNSGMEYPMLTADGGRSPTYYGLLAHEVGHNYFYGILGSNETYRAFMDEGFTNFITSVATREILGPNDNTFWEETGNWYQKKFYPEYSRKYYRNDQRYMRMSHTGYLENPLATHSNKFREYTEYRQVYYKGATMLWNLEYVLGDSLFREVMRTYVKRWMFKHPYPEDFVDVTEDLAGADFNWFFDEWIDNTSTTDYAINRVKNTVKSDGNYAVEVLLRRKDFMPMPIDLELEFDDGSRRMVVIPVNDKFVKTGKGAIIADPWFGWGDINDRYLFRHTFTQPVKRVRIDPSGRLADVNRLDNVSGPGVPVRWSFDNMIFYAPSLDAYDVRLRPSFLYNGEDGFKPGLHWHSNYMQSEYLSWWDMRAGLWYGPLSGNFGYGIQIETPVQSLGRLTKLRVSSQILEGRSWHSVGFKGTFREKLSQRPFTSFAFQLHRHRMTDVRYVPDSGSWADGLQQFLEVNIHHGIITSLGIIDLRTNLETSFLQSDFGYGQMLAEIQWEPDLMGFRNARLRLALLDSYGNPPPQRALYIAGGSPADAANSNWFYRSRVTIPPAWYRNNHVAYGGGLNLRGYMNQNRIVDNGMGFNGEFSLFDPLQFIASKIINSDLYLFCDGGIYKAMYEDSDSYNFAFDTGAGILVDLPWIPEGLGDYELRFDFPVYISDPIPGESNLQARWIFALGASW